MRRRALWVAILLALALSRLCHVRILWADGDYHLAAAIQMLRGMVPYRDFWFDKPLLTPLLYLAFWARPGPILMLASAGYLFGACLLAYVVARRMWGERVGRLAAALLAFHLIFYLPAAVIPLVPDLTMLVPHLAAIACLLAGFPTAAGAAAGVAFHFNVKGLFVLAVCLALRPKWWGRTAAGFVVVVAGGLLALAAEGALRDYWEQVWQWGLVYAGSTYLEDPWRTGLLRTLHWLGFHAAIGLGTAVFLIRERGETRRTIAIWMAISAAAVCVGLRFPPRYYFQLLPVIAIAGARGLILAFDARRRITAIAAGLLLLVPTVRFGPRYFMLASDLAAGRPHDWKDIALDQDNQAVARLVNQNAQPGDSLFVWGYRPGLYVYTRLRPGSRFMDSQPLTGIPAERHFTISESIAPEWARANRAELMRSSPTFVVDALGPVNPRLAIERFSDLAPWLAHYRVLGRTKMSVIYRR